MTDDPRSPEALRQLERAEALMAARQPQQAVAAFAAAAKLDPRLIKAQAGLGVALAMSGRMPEAADAFRRTAELSPRDAGAWSNFGKALQGLGRLNEAADALSRAEALQPVFPVAPFNLSVVLTLLGRLDEAAAAARRALKLQPRWAEAETQLGHVLLEAGDLEASVAASRRSLALSSNQPLAHNNLGVALHHLGRAEEAEAALRRAVALAPDWPDAHCSLAFTLLKSGRMQEGWREYEWRWRRPQPPAQSQSPAPRWSGQDVNGKTLLVESEQGVGDTIQFLRFAALAAQRGARVVMRTSPGLVGLLGTAPGLSATASGAEPPPKADYRCSVMSLPAHLGVGLETIPADVPYLHCREDLAARWRERLGDGFKIGLAWQGNRTAPVDRFRSLPLAAMAPLGGVAGVRLISIQKRDGLDQLNAPPPGLRVERLGPVYEDSDWDDTAAVIAGLDLVICCDTAVAHLAGALGKPVWMAVNRVNEWRWLTGRADSPWYPKLRLFHQPADGDWHGAFAAMASALSALPPAGETFS